MSTLTAAFWISWKLLRELLEQFNHEEMQLSSIEAINASILERFNTPQNYTDYRNSKWTACQSGAIRSNDMMIYSWGDEVQKQAKQVKTIQLYNTIYGAEECPQSQSKKSW